MIKIELAPLIKETYGCPLLEIGEVKLASARQKIIRARRRISFVKKGSVKKKGVIGGILYISMSTYNKASFLLCERVP